MKSCRRKDIAASINQTQSNGNQRNRKVQNMKDSESITQFLLGVTRDAIELGIVKEDGDPAGYDYEVDPKGYVACFISALHHWCHIHGLEWERELSWAEEFFKEDLWQTGGSSMLPARTQIEDGNCAFCGQGDRCETFHLQQAPNHPSMRQPTLEIEVSV